MTLCPVPRNSVSAAIFNISSIFAAGENGVWLEPWDLTTMFQDSAGTTPVTTYGQAVGLRLDKSKGLALGPEKVVNGDFSNGSASWTLLSASVSNDKLDINSGGAAIVASQATGFTQGTFCKVRLEVSNYVSGSLSLVFGVGTNVTVINNINANGVYEARALPGTGNTTLRILSGSSGFVGSVDNVSLKELPGNHAYQTTATARAIYGRIPATGKNNILANSVMAGGGAVPTGFNQDYGTGTSAPYGTINGNTQYRHTANASERPEFTLSAGTLGTTGSITTSLFIDEVLSGSPTIGSMIYMTGPAGSTVAYFKNGDAANSADLVSAGDRISAVLTSGGTSGAASARVGLGSGAVIAADVVFSRPMINVGATALTYQNSVSDYDTTEDGVQTLYGLKYDKLDDGYIFPSMTFTQPVTSIRGQRVLPSAATSWLFFFDANNTGTIYWDIAENGAGTPYKGPGTGTPTTYVNKVAVSPANRDAFYDATLNNNSIVTTKNLTIGTIALKAGLYASPYQFGGWEFGFVICEGMTDQEIASTEDYFNQHTGAY
jgi:hypothetical protein